MENKFVLSALKALIVDENGKFLLIRQDLLGKEFWNLPGGKAEFGEDPYDTLRREIKEELNVEIEIKSCIGMWYFTNLKTGHQINCTTFLCKIKSGKINVQEKDIGAMKWISKEEFVKDKKLILSHESLRRLIEKNG